MDVFAPVGKNCPQNAWDSLFLGAEAERGEASCTPSRFKV